MTMTTMTMTTITMSGMATMTKHAAGRSSERKPSRGRQGTADKVWAVGLAGATCLGLVGVVGVRAVGDAAAAEPQVDMTAVDTSANGVADTTTAPVATSTSGLTEEQLDQYARALEVERAKLEAYHKELLDAAAKLQASADAMAKAGSGTTVPAKTSSTKKSSSQKSSSTKNSSAPQASNKTQSAQPSQPAPKAVTKPVPKPAAKPAPKPAAAPNVAKPQAQTRGS